MSRNIARELAETLHAGQTDKAGRPYILHLERVVQRLRARWPDATEAEVEAAWLHDALEDTAATFDSLLAAGISVRAIEIVQLLTRPPGLAYLDWITALADRGDVSALRVKLADNADNSDPARVAALPGGNEMLVTRYRPARDILEGALALATR